MRDDSCFGRLCALLRGEAIVFDDEFEAYYRKVKAAIVEPAGFHSQCGQDRVVCELLEYKRGGVFMDLGAHDGVKYSNTYYLEKALGWDGLAVEPLPEVYAALCRNRTCRALNCCVGDRQGRAEFLAIDGYSEMLSGLLETYDPRHLERVERECGQHGCNRKVIEVDCVPPGTLFEDPRFRRVDYLSLDVEGCEERVLKAIPFDRTHISIITVENNFGDDGILRHLASHGFALLGKLPHDDIFIKGD